MVWAGDHLVDKLGGARIMCLSNLFSIEIIARMKGLRLMNGRSNLIFTLVYDT